MERVDMFESQVQDMRFRHHIRKYDLLIWDLYDFGLSNLNSQLLRCDSLKVYTIFQQL